MVFFTARCYAERGDITLGLYRLAVFPPVYDKVMNTKYQRVIDNNNTDTLTVQTSNIDAIFHTLVNTVSH